MIQDIDSIVEQFLLWSQRSTSCEPRDHPRALYADKVRFLAGDILFSELLIFGSEIPHESSRQSTALYLLLKSILLALKH